MAEWRFHGHAAHFNATGQCRFHLATSIGDAYVVSTVGDYFPRNSGVREDIEHGRAFETYVFRIDGELGCGCPRIVDWTEIDSVGANDAKAAEENHYAMCRKWDAKVEVQR